MRGSTVKIDDSEPTETMVAPWFDRRLLDADTVCLQPNLAHSDTAVPLSNNVYARGQTVDAYKIVKLIASGGTAHVYEAMHRFTRKHVALKIMRHCLAQRRDVADRFRQEAVALSAIRHENVVAVENAGLTDDGRVFIAMELLVGSTLRDHLRRSGKLTVGDTLTLMADVAAGVAAAHAAGVVHRDLKPENIFCVTCGKAKVLDLGTAKYAGEHTPTIQTAFGKIIGTAAYVAPERFDGEPSDARTDVYALGLIMYECLAGYHPLVPDGKWPNVAELALRQVTFEPRVIEGLPSCVWHIVATAIEKKPARRFGTVSELRRALQRVTNQLAAPASARASVRRKLPSVGMTQAVLGGSIFGMLVAGLAYWIRGPLAQAQELPAVVTVDTAMPEPSMPVPAVASRQEHELPRLEVISAPDVSAKTVSGVASHQTAIPAVSKPLKHAETSADRLVTKGEAVIQMPRKPKEDLPASGL